MHEEEGIQYEFRQDREINGWVWNYRLEKEANDFVIAEVVVKNGKELVTCGGPDVAFISNEAAEQHAELIADSLSGGDKPRGDIIGVKERVSS